MQDLLARPRVLPALIVLAGLGPLAAAFAAQYWGGIEPCILCIYQRYAHGTAAAVGLVALALAARPALLRPLVALAGLAFLTGAAIAVYHVGVEQLWWRGTAECHAPVFDPDMSLEEMRESLLNTRFVPCDQIPWALFGISIAGYNVLYSLVLGLALSWIAWKGIGAGSRIRQDA
jgi:disulfide bond formation protein DsbB